MRVVVAIVVVVVMGVAVLGVGQGSSPLDASGKRFASQSAAELAASKQRIAKAGKRVQAGKAEFEEQGCGDCHTLAAIGANGELGPRMDRQEDPLQGVIGNITQPRGGGPPGFSLKLMPTDYAKRMTPREIEDVARFIKAASG